MNKKKSKKVSFGHRNRDSIGVICMAVGTGMLLVILLPGWGFLLAAILIIIGFWCLFF